MPGYILTTASQIMCMHGGTAILTTANTTVKVDNMPALVETDIHPVAGCAFTIPPGKPSPCIRIEWSMGATQVKANETAVLIQSSIGKCISAEGATQGVAIIAQTQTKAQAM
ncbi:MAG: hypothetical protein ACKVQW_09540 [Pyrinomonadaceae bacterium]